MSQTLRVGFGQSLRSVWGTSAIWWLIVALGLGALCLWFGNQQLNAHADVLKLGLRFWLPEFRIEPFGIVPKAGQQVLEGRFQLIEPMAIGRRIITDYGWVNLYVTTGALLEPIVLAAATAAAWPQRLPWRLMALGLGAAFGVALVFALVPTMMAGMVLEKYYYTFAADQIRPFIIRVPRFLEGGGRAMLSLLLGLAAAGIVAAVVRARAQWKFRAA